MAQTFFFYDLETTGVQPRTARVMQFAGQRTSLDLQPIGDPVNIIIKLTPDILPEPEAILVTGITPQQTLQDGITEVEFLKIFFSDVATPDTIFVGYNTVRFDDEFMRFMLYRNFYDPYEWQWKDGRSRWDLLDVVRMTRALRPENIKWPFDSSGKPSNRLELLTAVNGIDHMDAHDALSDVNATIALAKLLQKNQPKLFAYLLEMRDKKKVSNLVNGDKPFVYSSGKYPSEYEKTTVVATVASHPKRQAALVYDLRHDPTQFKDLTAAQLADKWQWKKDSADLRLPVKTMRLNVCPAVAPLAVLDNESQARIAIDMDIITKHHKLLADMPDWSDRLLGALDILDTAQQTLFLASTDSVDAQLYDGFFDDHDRNLQRAFRAATTDELGGIANDFHDARLQSLAPLYKARNYPKNLSTEEETAWQKYRFSSLMKGGEKSRLAGYFARIQQLMAKQETTPAQQYLLEELQLYGQSIMLEPDEFPE